jgi:hypothetical protein
MKKFLGVFTKSNARAASPEDVAKITVVNKLDCVASLSRKTSAGLVTGSRLLGSNSHLVNAIICSRKESWAIEIRADSNKQVRARSTGRFVFLGW